MAIKILGLNRSSGGGGQLVQISAGSVSSLGNPDMPADATKTLYAQPRRAVIAFPNLNKGRMEVFGVNYQTDASNLHIWKTYNGQQRVAITTGSTWVAGDPVYGVSSGASGTVRETDGSTYLVIELGSSSPDFGASESINDGGSKSGTTTAASGSALGDAWMKAYKFATPSGADVSFDTVCRGFFKYFDGTDPKLALIYKTPGSTVARIARYDPVADSWSDAALTGTGTFSVSVSCPSIMFDNKIFTINGGFNPNPQLIDPVAGTITDITESVYSINDGYDIGFAIHGGSLYIVGASNSTYLTVWRYEGGGFVGKGRINLTPATLVSSGGFEAPDGSFVVIQSTTSPTFGTYAYTVNTTTWAFTSITSNLPSGFSSRYNQMITAIRDRNTNGPTGSSLVEVLFQGYDDSGNVAMARCAGASSWSDLGTYAGGALVFPGESQEGEGEMVYEDGAKYGVLLGGLANKAGAQEMEFTVLGGGTVTFELLVQERAITGESGATKTALQRGTLRNPSEGSLADGNKKITGITADGATKTMEWRGSTDGFSNGDVAARMPFITAS